MKVVGEGPFWSRCPSCDEEIEYRSDDPASVKNEARDHREWNPDHRPVARGPDGERLYG